jgi:CRISPR-associated protein Cmr3
MTAMIELICRDPIVSRDGRPFGAGQGNRMRSAGWLLPSVVAGALRTVIGTAAGRDFSVATGQELLQVTVAGAFPVTEGHLYLPVPQDCIVRNSTPLRAAPQALDDGGGDWPAEGLRPVMLTEEQAPDDFKPEQAPAWWPCDRYAQWLASDDISFDHRFLSAPPVDLRTHVQLDSHTGAAEEGMLFTTAALPLTHLARYRAEARDGFKSRFAEITLCARIRASQWCGDTVAKLDSLYPVGGERRLVHWKATETPAWSCPENLREALAKTQRARMVLATPGIFRDGWKPGWLNPELIGRPPGSNTTLKLVGVSIQRWRAVSGWSLASLPGQPRGPKPVRRVVPAGGVYFFETVDATTNDLDARWLEPVSDDEQDQRDGFGLAAWGTW